MGGAVGSLSVNKTQMCLLKVMFFFSTVVNHNFRPPFGRICFIFVPSILSKSKMKQVKTWHSHWINVWYIHLRELLIFMVFMCR